MCNFHILQVANRTQIHSISENIFSITFPSERFLEHTPKDIEEYYINADQQQLNFLINYPAVITVEQFEGDIKLAKISKINKDKKLRNITVHFEILTTITAPSYPQNIEGKDLKEILSTYKNNIDEIKNILNFNTLELSRFHWAIKEGNLFTKTENSILSEFNQFKHKFPQSNTNIKSFIISFDESSSDTENISNSKDEIHTSEFSTTITLSIEAESYVSEFIKKTLDLNNKSTKDRENFFRGHENNEYKLKPSLLRDTEDGKIFENNEHSLFLELLTTEPKSFIEDATCFDILTRMQHYSLPTRLLDISSNPLTALYFSCSSSQDNDGQVIIFSIKKDNINYFDSDKVSCLSNLARLKKTQKDKILELISECESQVPPKNKLDESSLENEAYAQYIHFIKKEKPFFEPKVKINDLKSVICVKGRLNQDRIIAQSGSFLIFGLNTESFEKGNDIFHVHRINIPKEIKSKIIEELDLLKINNRTVYPSMENSSKYIKEKLLQDAK